MKIDSFVHVCLLLVLAAEEEEEEEEEVVVVDVLEDDDIDEDDKNNDTFITPMNVILSVSSIRTALEGNLCCPRCRKTVMQVKDPTEGLGFAGSIDIYCKYCNKDTLNIGMGDQVRKPQEQQQEQPPNKKKKKKKTFIDYAINYKAILLMQQMGQSLQGLEMMLAYFGIAAGRGSYGKWKLIQDYVGEAEESICKEVTNENIEEEIRLVKNQAKEQYGHWHSTEEGRTSPQEIKVSKMQEYLYL